MPLILHSSPRRLRTAVLTGAVGLCVVTAAPAAAHDQLVGTMPKAGATVATQPSSISLNFSAPIMPVGTQIVVKDPSGTNRAASTAVSGSRVTTSLRAGGPAGRYQVAWRVVSQDGHPISGTQTFTTQRATTAHGTSPSSSTSSPVTAVTTSGAPAPATTGAAQTESTSPAWRPWALSLPIVALAALAITMLRRGRRR